MKRVAAYCRVSTDQEDQKNSLESQERFFREYINQNPQWVLVEIYVDAGITGTSTQKRAAFCRMMQDAQTHLFDLLLTKEISRFARNTLDSIYYTRELKAMGIGVIFLNDNINTLDPDAELRLTILSSIAQEESRRTSERVKWGQKRRMEQGVVFGRSLLGYRVEHGQLYIQPDEAKTVQLIFHKFVHEGKGSHVIARELTEACIPTSPYMKRWTGSNILRILRNEKYCGDLVQKKSYTPDYLSHQKKPNQGQEEQIILTNHHPPLISRQLFAAAQQKLSQKSPSLSQKRQYSNRYCFSGKIYCGSCGGKYVSRSKRRKDGSMYRIWRCYSRTSSMGTFCNSPSLNGEALQMALQHIMQHLALELSSFIQKLCHTLQITQADEFPAATIDAHQLTMLNQKRKVLLDMYAHGEIASPQFQQTVSRYEQQILKLQQMPQPSVTASSSSQELSSRIHQLISGDLWDEAFYRCLLDHIEVQPDGQVEVFLHHFSQPFCFQVLSPSYELLGL